MLAKLLQYALRSLCATWQLGGGVHSMDTIRKCSTAELEAKARQSIPKLRALVPSPAKVVEVDVPSFLREHGVQTFDLASIEHMKAKAKQEGASWKRRFYVSAVASGMGGPDCDGRALSEFTWLMRRAGSGILFRAVRFGSFDKVQQWILEGGTQTLKRSLPNFAAFR